jgi:hypothetical protein
MYLEDVLTTLAVKERNHNKLLLQRSRLKELGGLSLLLIFFSFWYYAILQKEISENNFIEAIIAKVSNEPMLLLFLGFPLLVSKQVMIAIKTIYSGDFYLFDRLQGNIQQNGKFLLNFSAVQNVQIRLISGGDSSDEYKLSLLLISGNKHFIENSNDESGIKDIAEHIADILNVSVVLKE